MNRRDALKRIGAGSAAAVVGPIVLPSFSVAHAASGGIGATGLIGVPEDGQDPVWYPAPGSGSDRKRQVGIVFDNSGVTCVDGSAPEFSVQWRIASIIFDSRGPKPVRLSVSAGSTEYATTPLVNAGYTGGGYGAVSYGTDFTMKKLRSNGKQELLRSFDQWQLVAMCRWHCDGAEEDVVAEYSFAGAGPSSPSVAPVSWDGASPA